MAFDDLDVIPRRRPDDIKDAETAALEASYAHITTHITEFAKLQYQLVGIAYALAGAILTFLASANPEPVLILFFPLIFCGIVLVELYLHSNIKAYGRYINFSLRPHMEAIINEGRSLHDEPHSVWDWEDYYAGEERKQDKSLSSRLVRFFMRGFGAVITLLPLIPAVITLIWYLDLTPPKRINFQPILTIGSPSFMKGNYAELVLFFVDLLGIVFTLVIFLAVHRINLHFWNTERTELIERKRNQLKRTVYSLWQQNDITTARVVAKRLLLLAEDDAKALYLVAIVEDNTSKKKKLLEKARSLEPDFVEVREALEKIAENQP